MNRDETGGTDYGRDDARDLGDEPPASYRDTAPDILAPIDISAPVSGHVPPPESAHRPSIAESPEHDWTAASALIVPLLRPVGTHGTNVTEIDAEALAAEATRSHSQPLLDEGPCDLAVVYAMPATGFDVIVNADHLMSWGVTVEAIQDAAMGNLAAWSATAAWTDEVSGVRRLISSDTGDGWDAARILLTEVRDKLVAELGGDGRVLIGLPERHLLIAGALRPGDDDFAALFGEFIVESSGGADEPIDRRVFELVDGRLVEFAVLPAPA
ncbi:MAG: hypothetical protein H0U52_08065 [Chloroflexi bacterium]|nr:hypothetical protein [Chloroflexota bacterium]